MAYKACYPYNLPMSAPSFEESFQRLEQLVQTLQQGGLTLEESLVLFEEGMKLARWCGEQLSAAELKVTQLRSEFFEDLPATQDCPPDSLP